MTKGTITTYLVNEILTKKARKHGVIVWYDPVGAFRGVLEDLMIERVRVVRLKGSFYGLRYDAEHVFRNLDRNSIAGEESLIVYVDRTPLEKRSDVLLGLEKAGTRFDWSLGAVVREALKGQVPRETLDSWLSNEKIRLEDLERLLAEGDLNGGLRAVSVVFDTTVAADVAIRYLVEPLLVAEVESRGAFDELRKLFNTAFGLPVDGVTSQETLRTRLCRHILMTEFIAGIPAGKLPSELATIPVARATSEVDACCRAAKGIRDRWRTREDYVELAESVEREFGLRSLKFEVGTLGNLDTFAFAEEIVLRSLGEQARCGQIDAASERLKEREGSFWSLVDPVRAVQWQAAQTALDLCREASRVLDELKQTKISPNVLAQNYSNGEEGRGRWFVADSLDRRLEWLAATAEVDFQVDDLIALARTKYRQSAELLTERFVQAIRTEGFAFGNISQQSDTFNRFIRPAMEKGPVAYFLVAGLRYEQASDLLSNVSFAERSELQPMIAVPPSISAIGLSALLPGAEGGICIREKTGRLAVEVDGATLAESADRVKFLKRRLGEDTVVDLPLADLLVRRGDSLRKRIEGRNLIVVRTPELDQGTSEARALQSRKLMGDLVSDLRRGIRRISEFGISQVVVASSHGQLLSWNLDELPVDPPEGHVVAIGVRSWIGRGGPERPDYVRFQASDVGIGGDLQIAVPSGLRLFKTSQESMPYVNGGMSPQEIVVPIATVTVAAPSSAATGDQFDLAVTKERITNRLFTVVVRYHKGSLLSPEDRRVRIVARSGKSEIGRAATALHRFDQVTTDVVLVAGQEEHVTIMLGTEVRGGSLVVAIVDSDTDATLKQTGEIAYDLPI